MTTEFLKALADSWGGLLPEILRAHWPVLLVLLLLTVARRLLRRPTVKGHIGEAMVKRWVLRKLDRSLYTVYDDLYLPRPDGKGTTQLDHVVVSPFGIFVIETKNMGGWIFGDEKSRYWTQSVYGKKSRFQNPLHQNALHVRALELALGLHRDRFHSLVFFVGEATLKTELPPHVATGGFDSLVRSHRDILLSDEELARVNGMLHEIASTTDRKRVKRAHVSSLSSRA